MFRRIETGMTTYRDVALVWAYIFSAFVMGLLVGLIVPL